MSTFVWRVLARGQGARALWHAEFALRRELGGKQEVLSYLLTARGSREESAAVRAEQAVAAVGASTRSANCSLAGSKKRSAAAQSSDTPAFSQPSRIQR